MDTYYQLSNYIFEITGTLVSDEQIEQDEIIQGRKPTNEYEILVDKKIINNMLNGNFSMFSAMGIKSETELLNKKVTINDMKDFTIVGFTDNKTETIYANRNLFINILNNTRISDYGMGVYFEGELSENNTTVKDYNLYLEDIKITKGRLPENDYEVIVNSVNQYDMKLNKTIKTEVNGEPLKVVGYYESKTNRQDYLVNTNTVKYNLISTNNGFMVYAKDKAKVLEQLKNEKKLNVIDRYEQDKQNYLDEKKYEIKSAVIFAGIILGISLIEIYLMIRSSFLSRIKEVGVLRAIGVKKKDIYRMFMGEIISITTIASLPGIVLMTYILSQIVDIPYVGRMFVVNLSTVAISVLLIYAFNMIVGLIPLFRVLRKTPAQILARHDIE